MSNERLSDIRLRNPKLPRNRGRLKAGLRCSTLVGEGFAKEGSGPISALERDPERFLFY